ncbi:MAG: serine hydrolase [Pseudomonadota bacterium]
MRKKLKIVGWSNGDFAVIYDGNLSSRTVVKTFVKHAEMLSKTGFDEPYVSKGQDFFTLYNVSYGMGRNLDSLKDTYRLLYSCLGEEVKRDLVIEKTDYDNYLLVYRLRGDQAATNAVARRQAAILKSKKISTSITKENNNDVVYGESSLMDDGDTDQPAFCKIPNSSPLPSNTAADVAKAPPPVPQKDDTALARMAESTSPTKSVTATHDTPKNSPSAHQTAISSENTKVERSIAEYIEDLRNKGIINKDESTGWMVYDLENDRNLVDINPDIEFQAASMIKPFVALAYFHKVKEGKLQYDAQSKRQMEAMIQRSSNSATNYIMRKAGGPDQCNDILKRYYGNIFKKTDIKEYIPADGRTYLNSATPADYVRFLRSLWNMELPYGKEIRRVMALPGRDRLYYGTNIPRGTLVYNKTGTTAHLCGDMGILVTKTKKGDIYPYAIVGIIERRSKASNYGQWMASRSRVIRDVSTLVYEGLKKDHQLL